MADTSPFHYRYPLTKLESSDDYLKITILEYIPPGFIPEEGSFALPSSDDAGYIDKQTGALGDKSVVKGTIILPIPDDVRDNNDVMWGNSSLNPLAAITAAAGAGLFNAKSAEDLKNKISSSAMKVYAAAQSGNTQKFVQGSAIGIALNTLLGNANPAEIASRYGGVVANSNIELIFTGVKLRDGFSFAFDITPRSQKEAQQVKDIIRMFKKHSAAKKGKTGTNAAGLFLKTPEVFRIEYMSGGKPHPYLNKFKICALKGMSVNYTGKNTYATYADGAPVNMVLGLGFQELTPIYAEDYDTTIGQEGTGY